MAASIHTCEEHGDGVVVGFTEYNCPVCQLKSSLELVTAERDELVKEVDSLKDQLENA